MTTKPGTEEYAPYYGKYVTLVPEGDIVATLASQINETLALLRAIPEEKGWHAYAPGKWSIKQSLGHLIDTERIMAYRALRTGGTLPAVLNAANEVAVAAFLEEKIRLGDIPRLIGAACDAHTAEPASNLDVVLAADRWARDWVTQQINGLAAVGSRA